MADLSPALATRYRPQTFDDLVGQPLVGAVLTGMVERKLVRPGLLFSGPSGTGKTTAARLFAQRLNPSDEAGLSVTEIDAASHGGVADVRELTNSLQYSAGFEYRVAIIDEAHSLTKDAFNALLKTLEEPPPGVVIILVTTEPHKIPETVSSRLMEFVFTKVSASDIYARLQSVVAAEGIPVEEPLLAALAQRAEGSVRRALMALDQAFISGISTLEAWDATTRREDVSAKILGYLVVGKLPEAFEALDKALSGESMADTITQNMILLLRDILVVKAGGHVPRSEPRFQTLASVLDTVTVFSCLQVMWDMRTKVRVSRDPRADLSMVLSLLWGTLRQFNQVVQVAQPVPEQPVPALPSTSEEEDSSGTLDLEDL